MAKTYKVRAHWDADAHRWWAESEDIPGVTEADTSEALLENVLALAPELIQLNLGRPPEAELPIHLMAERLERVRIRPRH